MSPSLRFIKETELDSNLYVLYKKLRSLFLEHGFTESELQRVTQAPDSIWTTHRKISNEFNNIRNSLRKYGMIEDENLPPDVSEYLENKMKEIDLLISLDGNKGYYKSESGLFNESVGFNKLESLIIDKLNKDAFETNYIEDNTMYWDGETDINESINAVWQVDSVEMIPSEKEGCDLMVHMVISPISDHSFVFYEDMGKDFDIHSEPHSVRLRYFQDASWIIDTVKSKVKNKMNKYFPFSESCIKLYFE
jgi:hypothetical protein